MMIEEPWNQLYRYWLGKHRDGRPPSIKDFDPVVEIPRLVSAVVLLKPVDDSYRYRLVGSEIVDRFGVGLTGRWSG